MIRKFKEFRDHNGKEESEKQFNIGINESSGWYNLTWMDLYKHGGLLNYPNNSPAEALQAVYLEKSLEII